MSREDLTKQVNIGLNAQRLLKDDLLAGIMFSKKNHACESFMSTAIGEDRKRLELWHTVQGVLSLERELLQLVDSGKMAEDELRLLDSSDQLAPTMAHNIFQGDA